MFFFSSRRRHTIYIGDWSSDVCSSDLIGCFLAVGGVSLNRERGTLHAHAFEEIGRASCREREKMSGREGVHRNKNMRRRMRRGRMRQRDAVERRKEMTKSKDDTCISRD